MKPLTPDEYAGALTRIGISNERFCHVVGINPTTGRKWKGGKAEVSATASALLRVLLAFKVDAAKLMELLPEGNNGQETKGEEMPDLSDR
jgi:DNA-binding transcriptional regulator YiaG